MLWWARGKTRLDHVRNVDIWKEAHMYPMPEFLKEKRLRWFGHVQRQDIEETMRKILQMTVDEKRNRGRPKLRWRDLVKEDMARTQMTTEMAKDRRHWHVMIRAGPLCSVEADRWEEERRNSDIHSTRNEPSSSSKSSGPSSSGSGLNTYNYKQP